LTKFSGNLKKKGNKDCHRANFLLATLKDSSEQKQEENNKLWINNKCLRKLGQDKTKLERK